MCNFAHEAMEAKAPQTYVSHSCTIVVTATYLQVTPVRAHSDVQVADRYMLLHSSDVQFWKLAPIICCSIWRFPAVKVYPHACRHYTGQAFLAAKGLCTLPHKAQLQCIFVYSKCAIQDRCSYKYRVFGYQPLGPLSPVWLSPTSMCRTEGDNYGNETNSQLSHTAMGKTGTGQILREAHRY